MDRSPPLEEALLPDLLKQFYGRVRDDPSLGPVFNDAVHDWDEHLGRLTDFWSSVMLATGRYKGNPAVMHLMHAPRITPAMFDRWLALWEQTTNERLPARSAGAIQTKARRIAESLQLAIRHRTSAQPPLQRQSSAG